MADAAAVDILRRRRGQSFMNCSFYDRDFSGQDLSHADFRGATLHGCKFDNCDLGYANFEGADCYKASFRQTRLYRTNFKDARLTGADMDPRDFFGTTITIHCGSVEGVKMSRLWAAGWLQLLMGADMPEEHRAAATALAESLVGPERLKGLRRAFGARDV